MAVGHWNIAPSEFWQMSVIEWWWVKQAKEPEKMYGSLPESKVDQLIKRQRERKQKERREAKEALNNGEYSES